MQRLVNKMKKELLLPLIKKACVWTIQTTQPQMCMIFLGQPKAPEELETVNMDSL